MRARNPLLRTSVMLFGLLSLAGVAEARATQPGVACETTGTCPVLSSEQKATLALDLQHLLQGVADSNGYSGGMTLGLEGQTLATVTRGIAKSASPASLMIDQHTRFPFASVSKTFVAALVWKRIEQGLLRLDTPIAQLVPWEPATQASSAFWNRVTVGQLLSHTSLLQDVVDNETPEDGDKLWHVAIARNWGADQMISAAQTLAPLATPAYSNTGYTILGRALEHPSLNGGHEIPIQRILASEIFGTASVDMADSGVLPDNRLDDSFAFPALGTLWDTTLTLRNPSLFFASGDLFGSILDLGKWGCALFSNAQVVSRPVLGGLWQAATPPAPGTGNSNTFGAYREPLGSVTLVYKTGGFPDLRSDKLPYAYTSVLAYVPEYSLTLGLLQNGSGLDVHATARQILSQALERLHP